jgi:hypothetical protein
MIMPKLHSENRRLGPLQSVGLWWRSGLIEALAFQLQFDSQDTARSR